MSHSVNITEAGTPISHVSKAVILLHGRGASAADILNLAQHLNLSDYALLAPQATNNSWYPYSFLAETDQNEPWLSSAIDVVDHTVLQVVAAGIRHDNIFFIGFSQGACLALEYVARHAKRYGGVAAFTGGLIGNVVQAEKYTGNFGSTPIFIGTGNPDSHVPLERVHQSVALLESLNAEVTLRVYDRRPHTISQDEINLANQIIFK